MKKANRIAALLMIALTAFLFYNSAPWPREVALLPRLLLSLIGILSVILLISGGAANVDKINKGKGIFEGIVFHRIFFTLVATIVYIVCIRFLGFYSSTYIFVAIMLVYIRYTKKLMFLIVPAGFLIFLYGIFTLWLKVPVPRGILF